ncbi:MAG: hypothetical protein IJB83_01820, partial [Bacilli bacterium]|nr:hypothetical protein [Bacilli bacterium]
SDEEEKDNPSDEDNSEESNENDTDGSSDEDNSEESDEEEKDNPSDEEDDDGAGNGGFNNGGGSGGLKSDGQSGNSNDNTFTESYDFHEEQYSSELNDVQQQATKLQQDVSIDEISLVAAVNKINSFDASSIESCVSGIISSLNGYNRLRKFYSSANLIILGEGVKNFLSLADVSFSSIKENLNKLLEKLRQSNPVFDEYVGFMSMNDQFGDDGAFELQKKLEEMGATKEDITSIYEELSAYAANSTIKNLESLEEEDYNYKESYFYNTGESREKVKQDYIDYAMQISQNLFLGLNIGIYDKLGTSQREINNYTVKNYLNKDYSNRGDNEKALVENIYLYELGLSDDELTQSDIDTCNLITEDYRNLYNTSDFTNRELDIIEKAAYIASFDKDGNFRSFEDLTITADEKEIVIPARSKHGNELFDFFTEITEKKDIRERSELAEYVYLNHELYDIERINLNDATDTLYSIIGTNENGKSVTTVDENERDKIIDDYNDAVDSYFGKIDDIQVFNMVSVLQNYNSGNMDLYYQYREGYDTILNFDMFFNEEVNNRYIDFKDSLVSNDIAKGESHALAEEMRDYHTNLLISEENELLNLNKKNKNDLLGERLSLANAYDWDKYQVEIDGYDEKIKENEERLRYLNDESIAIKENIKNLYMDNIFKNEQMSDFSQNVYSRIAGIGHEGDSVKILEDGRRLHSSGKIVCIDKNGNKIDDVSDEEIALAMFSDSKAGVLAKEAHEDYLSSGVLDYYENLSFLRNNASSEDVTRLICCLNYINNTASNQLPNYIKELSDIGFEMEASRLADKYLSQYDVDTRIEKVAVGSWLSAIIPAVHGISEHIKGYGNLLGGADGKATVEEAKWNYIMSGVKDISDVDYYVMQSSISVGNMAIPIAASALTHNPNLGVMLMGLSAMGNNMESALQEGMPYNAAVVYGALTGASEALLEKVIGGIPGLSNAATIGARGVVKNLIGESKEEMIQEMLDPAYKDFANWLFPSDDFSSFRDYESVFDYISDYGTNKINWEAVKDAGISALLTAGLFNSGKIMYAGKSYMLTGDFATIEHLQNKYSNLNLSSAKVQEMLKVDLDIISRSGTDISLLRDKIMSEEGFLDDYNKFKEEAKKSMNDVEKSFSMSDYATMKAIDLISVEFDTLNNLKTDLNAEMDEVLSEISSLKEENNSLEWDEDKEVVLNDLRKVINEYISLSNEIEIIDTKLGNRVSIESIQDSNSSLETQLDMVLDSIKNVDLKQSQKALLGISLFNIQDRLKGNYDKLETGYNELINEYLKDIEVLSIDKNNTQNISRINELKEFINELKLNIEEINKKRKVLYQKLGVKEISGYISDNASVVQESSVDIIENNPNINKESSEYNEYILAKENYATATKNYDNFYQDFVKDNNTIKNKDLLEKKEKELRAAMFNVYQVLFEKKNILLASMNKDVNVESVKDADNSNLTSVTKEEVYDILVEESTVKIDKESDEYKENIKKLIGLLVAARDYKAAKQANNVIENKELIAERRSDVVNALKSIIENKKSLMGNEKINEENTYDENPIEVEEIKLDNNVQEVKTKYIDGNYIELQEIETTDNVQGINIKYPDDNVLVEGVSCQIVMPSALVEYLNIDGFSDIFINQNGVYVLKKADPNTKYEVLKTIENFLSSEINVWSLGDETLLDTWNNGVKNYEDSFLSQAKVLFEQGKVEQANNVLKDLITKINDLRYELFNLKTSNENFGELVENQPEIEIKEQTVNDIQTSEVVNEANSETFDIDFQIKQWEDELLYLAQKQGKTLEELSKTKGSVQTISEYIQKRASELATKLRSHAESIEPKITLDLMALCKKYQSAELVGLDHKFKGIERLTGKIINDIKNFGSVENSANNIGDSLRYTVRIDDKNYVRYVSSYLHNLEKQGYKVINFRNTWANSNATYKGINTSIKTPDGDIFELQFHTPDSYNTKEFLNHKYYELSRNPNLDWQIVSLANKIMVANQTKVVNPQYVDNFNYFNIMFTNIPKKYAYDKVISKASLNGTIPSNLVIDDINVLNSFGTNILETIKSIKKIYGENSVQYISAKSLALRMYLQSQDIKLDPSTNYAYDDPKALIKKVSEIISSTDDVPYTYFLDENAVFDYFKEQSEVWKQYEKPAMEYVNELKKKNSFNHGWRAWAGIAADESVDLNIRKFAAMRAFTGQGYITIAEMMRNGDPIDDSIFSAIYLLSEELSSSVHTVNEPVVMFRGVDDLNFLFEKYKNAGVKADIDAIKVHLKNQGYSALEIYSEAQLRASESDLSLLADGSKIIADNSFISATPLYGKGFTYKQVVEVIKVHPGVKGSFVSKSSQHSSECEFTFQAGEGNRMVIEGVKRIGSQIFVFTEIVPE